MNLVVAFKQTEAGVVSLVGGNGSNLIALTAAGFPVPPGFIVTAAAYRLFLDCFQGLDQELAGFDYGHPEHLREQCAALRARLVQVPLPGAVTGAVREALQ